MYRSFVEELSRATGEAIDYQECGAMDLAYSNEEWDALLSRQEWHASFGISTRRLTASQLAAFSPHANSEGLAGGMFYPDEAVVSPRDLMRALRKACEHEHVVVRENTPVRLVRVDSERAAIEQERFSHVVIAAGAWSGNIAIEGAAVLPASKPVRGHLLGYDLQLGACPTILRHGRTYVFQRASGFVVAGASMEHTGFERGPDTAIVNQLKSDAASLMPLLARLEPIEVWTGFRPASDRLHLGRWQQTPIFLAYGHFRNGILLAPVTARSIADEILAKSSG